MRLAFVLFPLAFFRDFISRLHFLQIQPLAAAITSQIVAINPPRITVQQANFQCAGAACLRHGEHRVTSRALISKPSYHIHCQVSTASAKAKCLTESEVDVKSSRRPPRGPLEGLCPHQTDRLT